MIIQKKHEEKACNCRNSKCMKLYCECFAARVECNKNCRCIDCHNQNPEHFKTYKDNFSEKKSFKEEVLRQNKGCACRKSGCTKKYCQCYQAGILCTELCKCVECQNNECLSNKKVLSQLKHNSSMTSNKGPSLYPIILTQDNRHMEQILQDQNPLKIKDQWITKTAQQLYRTAQTGSIPTVIQKVLDILGNLHRQSGEQKDQIEQKVVIKCENQKMQIQEKQHKNSQIQAQNKENSHKLQQQEPLSAENVAEGKEVE